MAPLCPADTLEAAPHRNPLGADEALNQPIQKTRLKSALRTHEFLRLSALRLAYAENGCHMYALVA
jgi:hypothetical protein